MSVLTNFEHYLHNKFGQALFSFLMGELSKIFCRYFSWIRMILNLGVTHIAPILILLLNAFFWDAFMIDYIICIYAGCWRG